MLSSGQKGRPHTSKMQYPEPTGNRRAPCQTGYMNKAPALAITFVANIAAAQQLETQGPDRQRFRSHAIT